MPRPSFPVGVVLPVAAIDRINREQEYYDRNPEKAEREQRARKEREEEERRQLEEYEREARGH